MRTKKEQEALEAGRASYRQPLCPVLNGWQNRRSALLKLAVVLGIELLIAVAAVALLATFITD